MNLYKRFHKNSRVQQLEQEIKNRNLVEQVKLEGWQDDVDKYYKLADACLLTSNSEGWGFAAGGIWM